MITNILAMTPIQSSPHDGRFQVGIDHQLGTKRDAALDIQAQTSGIFLHTRDISLSMTGAAAAAQQLHPFAGL